MKVAVLLVVCAFAVGALAARQPGRMGELSASFPSGDFPAQTMLSRAAGLFRRRSSERGEEEGGYMTIRYTVPPSAADEFEDMWRELHRQVEKKEKAEMYHLCKTRQDNTFWIAYGEWRSVEEMWDHMNSGHVQDFTELLDKYEIHWEISFLDNLSERIEEEYHSEHGKKNHHGKKSGKEAHVMFYYIVPPGEGEGFVESWTKTAEKTIQEERNTGFFLRKVSTDNTRFLGFGSWEDMKSYWEHYESSHVGKLLEHTAESDITWFMIPLEGVHGHTSRD